MNSSDLGSVYHTAISESLTDPNITHPIPVKIDERPWTTTPLCSNRKVRRINLGKLITSTPAAFFNDTPSEISASPILTSRLESSGELQLQEIKEELPVEVQMEASPARGGFATEVPTIKPIVSDLKPMKLPRKIKFQENKQAETDDVEAELASKFCTMKLNPSLSPFSERLLAKMMQSSPEIVKRPRFSSRRCLRL